MKFTRTVEYLGLRERDLGKYRRIHRIIEISQWALCIAIAADNGQCKSILWQWLLVISCPGCSCPAEFTSTFGPDFAVNSHANSPSGHSRRWCSAASADVDYGRYSKRHKRLCGETNVAFMRITIPL